MLVVCYTAKCRQEYRTGLVEASPFFFLRKKHHLLFFLFNSENHIRTVSIPGWFGWIHFDSTRLMGHGFSLDFTRADLQVGTIT
jgi:hypothetical protein